MPGDSGALVKFAGCLEDTVRPGSIVTCFVHFQASTMGTRRRLAVSVRSCGICTQELPQADYSAGATPAAGPDAPVQVQAPHLYLA